MNPLFIAIIGLAAFISGALWRRLYGGWLAFERDELLLAAIILFGLPAWCVWHDVDTCWRAILIQAAIGPQFCLGVQFDVLWLCALRYTIGMLPLALLTMNPWPLLVGPWVAAIYDLGKVQTAEGHPWVIRWPWDTATEQMTNGYTAFGELAAGGLSALAFAIAPLLVSP